MKTPTEEQHQKIVTMANELIGLNAKLLNHYAESEARLGLARNNLNILKTMVSLSAPSEEIVDYIKNIKMADIDSKVPQESPVVLPGPDN